MTRQRKKYSAEFKREAVGLVMEHGYSRAEAGRSLGIKQAVKIQTMMGADLENPLWSSKPEPPPEGRLLCV